MWYNEHETGRSSSHELAGDSGRTRLSKPVSVSVNIREQFLSAHFTD